MMFDFGEELATMMLKGLELQLNKKSEDETLTIKEYKVYDKTVVVWFEDGVKTSSTCLPDDKFDLEVGIEKCILKKIFGDNYYSQIQNVIKQQEKEKAREEKNEKEKIQKIKDEQRRIEKIRKKKLIRKAKRELEIEKIKKELKSHE